MLNERDKFLSIVGDYLAKDPGAVPHLFMVAEIGISKALEKALDRARDMEVALLAAASKKYPKADARELIIDKIKAQNGKTSLVWDWLLKELETKEEKNDTRK